MREVALGQCPACHKLHYSKEDIGQPCKQTNRCLGLVRPYEQDPDTIDGNLVIDFIKAIHSMADIFEKINIGAIKEAFVIGTKFQVTQDIVEQEKKWHSCMETIVEGLKTLGKMSGLQKREIEEQVAFMNRWISLCNNAPTKDAIARTKTLSDLLDNLERHRASGLIEIISKL